MDIDTIDDFYDDEYDDDEGFFDERRFPYRPSPLGILILLLLILAMLLPFLSPVVSAWLYHQSPTPTPEPSFWQEKEVAEMETPLYNSGIIQKFIIST
ncbi:hypothetical protein QUF64_00895 [Anaerolineales bacterium HSG6]|nr:hypothetical protein [Anaerolineales bacterium HSG6]